MKKKTLFSAFLIAFLQSFSQSTLGSFLSITSSEPQSLTICSQSQTFTIAINNPSAFLIQTPTISIVMPVGMSYQGGSVLGATPLSTASNTLVFSTANIPTLTNRTIVFSAYANCNIIPFLSGGSIPSNTVKIDYLASGNPYYQTITTANYSVKQPNLSITTITNQTYNGTINGTFMRCITIINGGFGALSQFTLTNSHGASIDITSVNLGNSTNSGNVETTLLNGTHFATIGDNDNLFETGESITVCENIAINNCIDTHADYKAYWGCDGSDCQASTSSGNVVFNNITPNLIFQPNGGNIYAPMNSCIGAGNASQQVLKVYNNGTGLAINTQIEVNQYPYYENSMIDLSSLTTQVGYAGTTNTMAPTSFTTQGGSSCFSSNKVGDMVLSIPVINPGDTIYLKWNTYSCCYSNNNSSTCGGIATNDLMNGWFYKAQYENICQTSYHEEQTWGRVYSQISLQMTNNLNPTYLTDNESGTFSFQLDNYAFNYPVGPGNGYKLYFTLPPCLTYNGNLSIINSLETSTWSPTSVTTSTNNVITATFNGLPPFDINLSNLFIDLTASCSACGGAGGANSIGIKMTYISNSSCSCETDLLCLQSTPVVIACPSPCPEGIIFKKFNFRRTSLGLPDNEPGGGDGVPDVSGSLNFSKIRTDRAMFQDTIMATYIGTVRTSTTFPSWQNCYISSYVEDGNKITFKNANLEIYRGGTLLVSCLNFTPTIQNVSVDRRYNYNLTVSSLSTCLPSGFVYSNNDSLVFKANYVVTTNIGGGALLQLNHSSNEFYVSPVITPTNSADKYQCNTLVDGCSITGYYYTTAGADDKLVKSCNEVTVTQNYYLSIGECCSNYHGGNMFPFEYRNWAHVDTLVAIVPLGYEFISAQIIDYRTRGSNNSFTTTHTVTPLSLSTNTLVFDAEKIYTQFGGTAVMSDDGFAGTLNIKLRPSCATEQDTAIPIHHNWTFAPINKLTLPGSLTPIYNVSTHDKLTYDGPDMFLQANLLTVNVPDDTTGWVMSITNNSNVNAHNVWVSAPTINGVAVTKIYDLNTNTQLTPVNGIYQLGLIAGGISKNILVVATFTSCLLDSVIVHSGWNCSGYPNSLSEYPCTTKKITLKENPLLPNIVTNAQGPTNTVGLCQEATYTVSIKNVQLGTAYNLSLTGVLPIGTSIVPGSTQLSYPTATSFTTVADPVFVSGTQWRWDIYNTNNTINSEGLKGVLTPSNSIVTLTFKIIAGCGYISGSSIGFSTKAIAACGSTTGDDVSISSNLSITGAVPPYHTQITLGSKFITPCHGNNTMRVGIKNLGSSSFQSNDSIYVLLPQGVTFVAGSFSGIHNPPLLGVPNTQLFNGQTYLIWGLPAGVVMNDSTVFDFQYVGDEHQLLCEISTFEAKTLVKQTLTCLSNSSSCDVSVITGDTLLDIFTYKSYLAINSVTATSTPTLSAGEVITIAFNIKNNGEQIDASNPTTVSYYYDNDNNGVYSTNDLFITNDVITSQIDSNGVFAYSATIQSSTITSCGIIAVVDTALNHCSCTGAQAFIIPKYKNAGVDTFFCSAYTGLIGLPPITNFSYTWSPSTGLSNTNASNPNITFTNTTSSVESYTYIITTNKGFCITKDTTVIAIEPLPKALFTSDNVCYGATTNFTNNSTTSSSSSITSITWNYGDNSVSTGTTNTHYYSSAGTHSVQLTIQNNKLCKDSITQTLVVYNKPLASFTSNTVCVNSTTSFSNTSTIANPDNITDFEWDFENNITIDNTTPNPSYTYSGSITFTASLIVTTNNGCKDTIENNVSFFALPTASFTADSACFQSLSHLQDVSVGNGFAITSFAWDFNNDNVVDNSTNNPTPTFTTIGNNMVSYTVSTTPVAGITCTDTIKKNVWIRALPVASFSVTSVCQGLQNQFTDLSTIATGSVTQWHWDYTNNGSIDNTSQNPIFTYVASGTYTALFIAETIHGCRDSVLNVVNVWGHATPDFDFNTVCFGSVNSFTNTSTVLQNNTGAIVSSNWAFGDNTANSNLNSPTHTYATPSNSITNTSYTVQLVINTNNNCKDSITKTITVYSNPTAAFISDSVCFNLATTLTDASNGNGNPLTNYEWDFNNDNTIDGIGSNTTHVFSNNGINTVNYTVSSNPIAGLACKTTTIQNVWVNPLPKPAFTFTNNCENTQPNYFDAYASVISIGTNSLYAWDFGDGQAVTGTIPLTNHTYLSAGLYTVSLTVVSNKGCDSTVTRQVEVYAKPRMQITASSKVCIGSTTTFTASTLANSGNVTSWQWDVNNFIPSIETSGQSSAYTFANPGSQTLTLLTITDHFCKDTTKLPVYVNYFPVTQFTINSPSGCETHCVTFTDLSANVPMPDKISHWTWNFGNGNVLSIGNNNAQTMCYDNPLTNQIAPFSVMLTTQTDSGCVASISHTNIITVYPKPIANFSIVPELGNVIVPQVLFDNQSIDYTHWAWSFGDGSKQDTLNRNPTHYYNSGISNTYQTILIISNQYGCSDTAMQVFELSPDFVFYIPNAFSPTEDGINEVFTGVGVGITKYEMWLYDRWGEQIYYTDDINKGWNGKKQGTSEPCKQDVYVWKVELKDVFDKKHNYVGHVTLLR